MDDQDDLPLPSRTAASKARYALPSPKIATPKQFLILKALGVLSGPDLNAVALSDIAGVTDVHAGTISLNNPFLTENKIIEKVNQKFRPCPEVLAYVQREGWGDLDAGRKLEPVLKESWFAKALMPRLQMGEMTEEYAIKVLAEAANAGPHERRQLGMLLDYLQFGGLITAEGGMIRRVPPKDEAYSYIAGRDVELLPATKPVAMTATMPIETFDEVQIPVPGYPNAVIQIPKGMDDDDWSFFQNTLDSYLRRFREKANAKRLANSDD